MSTEASWTRPEYLRNLEGSVTLLHVILSHQVTSSRATLLSEEQV